MKCRQRLDNSEESPLQKGSKSTTKWTIQTDIQDTPKYKKYTKHTAFNGQTNSVAVLRVNFQVAIPLH